MGMAHDHMLDVAAVEAVAQVIAHQQRGGRDHHRAQLDQAQHRLPQRALVGQHQQHAVAAPHALGAQPVGRLAGTLRQLGKAQLLLAPVLLDDPQGRRFVAPGHHVEVVQGPVEAIQGGPPETGVGGGVVLAVVLQKLAGLEKGLRGGVVAHGRWLDGIEEDAAQLRQPRRGRKPGEARMPGVPARNTWPCIRSRRSVNRPRHFRLAGIHRAEKLARFVQLRDNKRLSKQTWPPTRWFVCKTGC
jgi:hypothetical protein